MAGSRASGSTLVFLAASALAAATTHGDARRAPCASRAECGALLNSIAAAAPRAAPLISTIGSWLLDARDESGWAAVAAGRIIESTNSAWCPSNAAFDFVPVTVGNVTKSAPRTAWTGDACFSSMTATAAFNTSGATITLAGTNPSGDCSDVYVVGTSFSIQIAEVTTAAPSANVVFASWNGPYDNLDAQVNGVKVWLLPCNILGTLASVINTVALFDGNGTAMAAANAQFLQDRRVWPLKPFGLAQELTPGVNLRSPSYLAISRFDGLDPMIMWGTGTGATGHSVLVVQDPADGLYYATEVTDFNPFGSSYWPEGGVQRHEWSEWVALATNASFHVSVLPMREDLAAAFNYTAFWNWFYTVQGQPYGYHNMLMSLLDTTGPFQNMPLPIDDPTFTLILNLADGILPNASAGVSVFSLFTWAANQRLNSSCTTLGCIINLANINKGKGAAGPTSLSGVFAIPENDNWRYGPNVSMVCSAYAAHGINVGLASSGLLPPMIATEQTPINNFQMAIWDGDYYTSANCPTGLITPLPGAGGATGGNVCQIMGTWAMPLNGFNTIAPYAGINNACAAQWPSYTRCPNGAATCQC